MAARAALFSLISTDAQIQLLGLSADSIFGSNATDSPRRDSMFAIIRWEDAPLSGGRSVYITSIWYHMPKEIERDYGKIDLAILRTKELMKGVEHLSGGDGWALTAATHLADSPDLYDDGYNSLTRYTQFRCACRNLG